MPSNVERLTCVADIMVRVVHGRRGGPVIHEPRLKKHNPAMAAVPPPMPRSLGFNRISVRDLVFWRAQFHLRSPDGFFIVTVPDEDVRGLSEPERAGRI